MKLDRNLGSLGQDDGLPLLLLALLHLIIFLLIFVYKCAVLGWFLFRGRDVVVVLRL